LGVFGHFLGENRTKKEKKEKLNEEEGKVICSIAWNECHDAPL
jgi:hypothetical protein